MSTERNNPQPFYPKTDRSPEGRPPGFTYREARNKTAAFRVLHCEKADLRSLAEKFGTPLYVYSTRTVRERYRTFEQAFRKFPHTICYSVKANSSLGVLRLLWQLGSGFDVVSGGELERVLAVNRRAAGKVVFSGVGKTALEMDAALRAGILLFNIESESELELLAQRAERLRVRADVALRVNPDVPAETHPYISTGLHQHKFGVPMAEARRLYRRATREKYLQVAGLSLHIGSQITTVKPFAAAVERVAELIAALRQDGHEIPYVDAGGGLGISYEDFDAEGFSRCAAEYAQAITSPLHGLKVHLLLEPGRAIVGPAGMLLTKVLYRKKNNGKHFLIVDAAMNDLLRPSLYGAYHEIVPVVDRGAGLESKFDVVGPVCETGDFLARDRAMPEVKEGELLAILDAGAYGMSLASNYNTRPRAAEVLVEGRAAKMIRRRETVKELMKGER